MRFETIPETKETVWLAPGESFPYDLDLWGDDVPESDDFVLVIKEEYGQNLAEYDANSTPPLVVTATEDGKNLTANLPGSETVKLDGKTNLIWLLYLRVDGEPLALLKGSMKLDGDGFFTGPQS